MPRILQLLIACGLLAIAPASGQVLISEFMADNGRVVADEDGDFEDWIELFNAGADPVDLAGWHLTDDSGDLARWTFPSTHLAPGGFALVFASGKDRAQPGQELHTSFRLSKAGGYLGLVATDGVSVVSAYPSYPAQATDVSYGWAGVGGGWQPLLGPSSAARFRAPASAADYTVNFAGWTNRSFNDSAWTAGLLGMGFDRNESYGELIGAGGDSEGVSWNLNASLFVRIPFVVADTAQVVSLRLLSKHDDGCAFFLNGARIASDNAPAALAWNSAATAERPEESLEDWMTFSLTNAESRLVNGTNILAVQGLNAQATNTDLLVLPQLEAAFLAGTSATNASYLATPTPGSANAPGSAAVGPQISAVTDQPARPTGRTSSPPVQVTAAVHRALDPVASVRLFWCVMFGAESNLVMRDDGVAPDAVSNDAVFSATVPTAGVAAGQMLRWRVEATDTTGVTNRAPSYLDPVNSPRYFGTVALETNYATSLPLWYWFCTNVSGARALGGARCSVFYQDQFRDNAFVRRRGGYTSYGSQKFDFNRGEHLRINDAVGLVEEANLNSNGVDAAQIRPPLAFETHRLSPGPASHSFFMQLRLNGGLDRWAYYAEQVDERFLARNGLDPEGALYKFVQRAQLTPVFSDYTDGVEKKTRTFENNSDLQALVAILNTTNEAQRERGLFDALCLPEVVNFLACRCLIKDADDVRKNFYLYRDTNGDAEWRVFPWDKDSTYGVAIDGGASLVHPFFGDYAHRKVNPDQWNILWERVFNTPRPRDMYLRRLRTLMDEVLQPPGTPSTNGYLEGRARHWMNALTGTVPASVTGQLSSVLSYIAQRRTDLFTTYSVTNPASPTNALIPLAQPPGVMGIGIAAMDVNPVSGNQQEEFIQLTNGNAIAVDLTGWTLSGAVRHVFPAGTVIPAGDSLYLTPSARAFRARDSGPSGGQGLFVQGGYEGQLSAWGESLLLSDRAGRVVVSNSYAGAPSDAQRYLRITEIMADPATAPGSTFSAQDYEFIELRNISTNVPMDLTGVRFTNGISYAFSGDLFTNLPPGGFLVLARHAAAFAERYGTNPPVAGVYGGALDGEGEAIRLEDAGGEKILDFTYATAWCPLTRGHGFSLVIRDDRTDWAAWGQAVSWRTSAYRHGSPGAADPDPVDQPGCLITEAVTHTDPPLMDAVELFNPHDLAVDLSGWLLSDDLAHPAKYCIPEGTVVPAYGYCVFDESQFNMPSNAPGRFNLDSTGEAIWLFSADAQTNLTGFVDSRSFGAAHNGISFGRHVNSVEDEFFVAQSARTLGLTNALPRVRPVGFSEIHYHPPLDGTNANVRDEFIELCNAGAVPWPLYDALSPSNRWQLQGAVAYTFPTGVILSAQARLLVVGFDPATNLAALGQFRTNLLVPTNELVLGPWTGTLDNAGERISLFEPDPPNSNAVPYVLVESVTYAPTNPWPAAADGQGASLQRIDASAFADDPINWYPAAPTPGAAAPLASDVDSDGVPDWKEWLSGTDPSNALSLLAFTEVTNAEDGVYLVWPSGPGKAYAIEVCTNLLSDAGFVPWRSGVAAQGDLTRLCVTNEPGATSSVYRIRLTRP